MRKFNVVFLAQHFFRSCLQLLHLLIFVCSDTASNIHFFYCNLLQVVCEHVTRIPNEAKANETKRQDMQMLRLRGGSSGALSRDFDIQRGDVNFITTKSILGNFSTAIRQTYVDSRVIFEYMSFCWKVLRRLDMKSFFKKYKIAFTWNEVIDSCDEERQWNRCLLLRNFSKIVKFETILEPFLVGVLELHVMTKFSIIEVLFVGLQETKQRGKWFTRLAEGRNNKNSPLPMPKQTQTKIE